MNHACFSVNFLMYYLSIVPPTMTLDLACDLLWPMEHHIHDANSSLAHRALFSWNLKITKLWRSTGWKVTWRERPSHFSWLVGLTFYPWFSGQLAPVQTHTISSPGSHAFECPWNNSTCFPFSPACRQKIMGLFTPITPRANSCDKSHLTLLLFVNH